MSGVKMIVRHGTVRLLAKADHANPGYVEVVGGKSRTYLWIGDDANGCYATVSGRATLRRLAECILAELGEATR